jgi:hypothetical protein
MAVSLKDFAEAGMAFIFISRGRWRKGSKDMAASQEHLDVVKRLITSF